MRDIGIDQFRYDDEFFEYHGFIAVDGRKVAIHFPLTAPTTEMALMTKHRVVLDRIASQCDHLIAQAANSNQPHSDLPDLNAIIIDEGGTFDLQFGSSRQERPEFWCEAMYLGDGTLYHFERHPLIGDAA